MDVAGHNFHDGTGPGETGLGETGLGAAPDLIDTPEARDALCCPLCGYSLRGLRATQTAAQAAPEPAPPPELQAPERTWARCPECGYPCHWRLLLHARQFSHPYLFEHHPRRKLW